jgi:aspartate/methionine/tyrosine aminotransferase
LSDRWRSRPDENQLSLLRARLAAAGQEVVDLADTNPTRHGLGAPAVLDVWARAAASAGRYDPDPRGPGLAREALAERFGGHCDDYWLTASTSEAYSWLAALLADPGDDLAIPAPGYPLIDPLARFSGLGTRSYPLHYIHPYGWALDVDRLDALAARPGTRAVIAVNPGNPTGAYVDAAEQSALVEVCRRHGLPLIADEVFGPFALERPAATRLGGLDTVLAFGLDGLSKLLCAPGLKVGWIQVSGPQGAVAEVRPVLDVIADTFLPVSTAAGLALPGLLELADEVIATTRARLAGNLAQLHRALDLEPVRIRRCEGGWTALVDLPPAAGDPALSLLSTKRLAVHPGWFYDLADPGCVALSLLSAPEIFAEGCARLGAWVEEVVAET